MSRSEPDAGASRRLFLEENATYLVIGFLVLAALGGYLAYDAMTAPDVETESITETTATWTTESSFEHGATVRTDTRVFPEGTHLRNRPTYFTDLMPVLEGEYILRHHGITESVSGSIELDLVLRSTEEIDGSQFSHWEERETLTTKEFDALEPGESKSISFEVNITELNSRLAAIQGELGASPGSNEILLQAHSRLHGTADGWQLLDNRTESISLQITGNVYEVSRDVQGQETQERQESVQREQSVETPSAVGFGGPLLLLVGLLGALGVGLGRYTGRFDVDSETRNAINFQRVRDEHDDWISIGDVPDESDDRTVVRVDSLDDIVDVAIDTNNRVIEDEERGSFTVITESVRYVYLPSWRSGRSDDDDSSQDGSEVTED